MDEQTVLTLYSLNQQVKEWNADEMPNAEEETPPQKYAMWLQQKDKDEVQCMKEYIVIISQYDIYTKQIMWQLLEGIITEIKYVGQEA